LLQGDFQIIVNINPIYKDTLKVTDLNKQLVYMQQIDRYASGPARQMMYHDLYLMSSRTLGEEKFDLVITDKELKKIFIADKARYNKVFTPYNLIDRLKNANVDSSVKNRLVEILEDRKNSYIYLDMLGTWCARWMHAMPL
jgi:hypothetical protein